MKTFLTALIVVIAIGLISDIIFGGSVSKSGFLGRDVAAASGMWGDTSAAAATAGANVRLPGQGDEEAASE